MKYRPHGVYLNFSNAHDNDSCSLRNPGRSLPCYASIMQCCATRGATRRYSVCNCTVYSVLLPICIWTHRGKHDKHSECRNPAKWYLTHIVRHNIDIRNFHINYIRFTIWGMATASNLMLESQQLYTCHVRKLDGDISTANSRRSAARFFFLHKVLGWSDTVDDY